ncbi:MAG: hypothetical protein JO369_00270 [Paucibacter sp.]|nr:hypothetical protein [Roseateles sp.]
MRNTEHHDQALRQLGNDLVSGALGLRAFRGEVTALLRERFRCDQVVLWCIGGGAEERSLRCVAERHGERVELDAVHTVATREIDGYLEHLLRAGVYAAPATALLNESADMQALRLHPSGARNMLHAGASYNGRFLGVVCCERRDLRGVWTPSEQVDLRRITARIALYVGTLAERNPELLETES